MTRSKRPTCTRCRQPLTHCTCRVPGYLLLCDQCGRWMTPSLLHQQIGAVAQPVIRWRCDADHEERYPLENPLRSIIPRGIMDRKATCKSCQAAILWLTNTKSGHVAPIDAEPADDGNCVIEGETYRLIIPRDRPQFAGQLHKNHFATCPTANLHQKAVA